MFGLLRDAGFEPDFAAGHSFGELTALWAAGAMDERRPSSGSAASAGAR